MPNKLEITPELALSAAKVLKEYCEGREECHRPDICAFYKNGICDLNDAKLPTDWDL